MAACDDDSESPSGSGLRSVSSRSFFWPYGAPHRRAFFFGFTRYKNLQEGKQFFHILFFVDQLVTKRTTRVSSSLRSQTSKSTFSPEGLDHFFRKDDKLLVRIGVDVEGVAFFQQALFQFHGHVDAVTAQPFIQMVRKELRKLDGRHKSLWRAWHP